MGNGLNNRHNRHTINPSIDVFVSAEAALVAAPGDIDSLIQANDSSLSILVYDATQRKYITKTTALVAGDKFIVAQKVGDTVHKSSEILFDSLDFDKRAYVAPQKQVTIISNIEAPTAGDIYGLTIIDNSKLDQPYNKYSFEATEATASTTVADIVTELADLISDRGAVQYHAWDTNLYRGIVGTSDAGSAIANDVTVVNGSTLVTSTAHGLDANDYVSIDGDTYLVASVNVNDFTLARNYTGASATVLAASVLDLGATPSDFILAIEAVNFGETFSIAKKENLESATVTREGTVDNLTAQKYILGSGDADSILRFEKDSKAKQGFLSQNALKYNVEYGEPNLFTEANAFYTVYSVLGYKAMGSKAAPVVRTDERVELFIAVKQADNTTPATALDTVFGV
jgi:hypothetical protein